MKKKPAIGSFIIITKQDYEDVDAAWGFVQNVWQNTGGTYHIRFCDTTTHPVGKRYVNIPHACHVLNWRKLPKFAIAGFLAMNPLDSNGVILPKKGA
jgi:hypothetical protein